MKIVLFILMTLSSPTIIASSQTAIFAGGCFWCVEHDLEKLSGVTNIESGYADGDIPNPTYTTYNKPKNGQRSHLEVVKIYYDNNIISYADLINALFRSIDPTDNLGQFADRGIEYRPAIFYANQAEKNIAQLAITNHQQYYSKPINLELIKTSKFYPAEDYHQDYGQKNPIRYKYYRYGSGRDKYLETIWQEKKPLSIGKTSKYQKPSATELKTQLSKLQYKVTQQDGTEPPFNNSYWDNKTPGIYVEITTGEPLFSSLDKYKSGTGWPSFTKPISKNAVAKRTDYKLIYPRTEIRSIIGDAHIGHLFNDGPKNQGGLRYCMNSAALKFIPATELAQQGYGEFKSLFE